MQITTQIIQKRLKSIGVFVLLLCILLVWRIYDLQVIKHGHYSELAFDQQRFEKVEMAERGKIYAHDSFVDDNSYFPLAFDMKKYAVWVVPNQVKDKNSLAAALSPMLTIPQEEIFSKIDNNKLYIPPLKRGLNYDEANKITALSQPGVFVMPEYSRYYPEGTLASQILGFVNSEGDGKYGFEGHYNNELKGKEGNVKGEKDTLGRVINLLEQNDPKDGTSYVLTINRSVQYFVEKKLAEALPLYQADSGTVVVMDVKTGGIVAMASTPTYDPNNFKEQAKADSTLFVNPSIAHLYEPGSIFKTVVMASALDAGAVTPDTTETFSNSVNVDGFDIHTAEDKAFGKETMTQVLENSDNVGMVWVSDKLGKEKMYDYIKKFGFFDKTGIDLDSEVGGYAPELKRWRNINRATISFGQGITVTPIEMLAAYAAIANKGIYIHPHIVDKVIAEDGSEKRIAKQEGERVISEETANNVKNMLYSVVLNGHSKKAAVPGFKVGAKTGTAQIPNVEGGGYEKDIYIHSVEGLAPIDDPRFVMLVKLDRPKVAKYAESTAAPLFGEIANYLLNYYYRLSPTEQIK